MWVRLVGRIPPPSASRTCLTDAYRTRCPVRETRGPVVILGSASRPGGDTGGGEELRSRPRYRPLRRRRVDIGAGVQTPPKR